MGGRKLSLLPAGAGLVGLGLALSLAAVAAQGGGTASPDLVAPDAEASFANRPPLASALSVDPGGPYTAEFFDAVSGGVFASPRFWTAEVTASASGGAGSYTFRWQGTSEDGNPTTYAFTEEGTYKRSVTVTDANGNQKTSDPPAEIVCSPPGGAGGASDGERGSISVPLGGTLDLVWGNGGLTSASSKDAGVATASVVSGHELTVTGVSVGETDIVVQAGGVEYWLPVRVEDG